MILVDANLLVYAKVSSMAQHAAARVWLEGALAGPERVGLPWESLLAFPGPAGMGPSAALSRRCWCSTHTYAPDCAFTPTPRSA